MTITTVTQRNQRLSKSELGGQVDGEKGPKSEHLLCARHSFEYSIRIIVQSLPHLYQVYILCINTSSIIYMTIRHILLGLRYSHNHNTAYYGELESIRAKV